jgi:N6-adenosine-specific RNA methylase IME4
MTLELSQVTRRYVPSVPAAMKSLSMMERELGSAKTYDHIRKIMDASQALKLLYKDVDAVRWRAEDTIREAAARIGEEIKKIPKAGGSGRGNKRFTSQGKSFKGREATGIAGTSRARFQKLASVGKKERHRIATKLRDEGKDATVTAVVREIVQGGKKEARERKEKEIGAKIVALPSKRYGVIYADPPWKYEVFNEDTGSDRLASNHYPLMNLEEIKNLKMPAADDCVLFLWATVPLLPQGLEVMEAWGFRYRSNFVWVKHKIGLGHWNRNKHEHLLVGARGSIPAPAMGGNKSESVIVAPSTKHSEKPPVVRKMIEEMFPSLPRLEMFSRGRWDGWDVWGPEI